MRSVFVTPDPMAPFEKTTIQRRYALIGPADRSALTQGESS